MATGGEGKGVEVVDEEADRQVGGDYDAEGRPDRGCARRRCRRGRASESARRVPRLAAGRVPSGAGSVPGGPTGATLTIEAERRFERMRGPGGTVHLAGITPVEASHAHEGPAGRGCRVRRDGGGAWAEAAAGRGTPGRRDPG